MGTRGSTVSRGRKLLIAAGALVALGASAGPAMGASVDGPNGGFLDYSAAVGETNALGVTQTGLTVIFDDTVAVTTTNPACTAAAGNVTCTLTATNFGISITLDDLNDSTRMSGVSVPTQQSGDLGDDTLQGGSGGDTFFSDAGADSYAGGDGFDDIQYFFGAGASSVTLDGVANDGLAGEGDNVGGDIEDVLVFATDPATITGNSLPNMLTGGAGADTIDGGPGSDSLFGDDGNDTLRSRDGFSDRVSCGTGSDTATVDTLDLVSDCETVERADAGNALDVPEDRPPSIAFLSPAANALVSARGANVTFSAADDRGVARVQLFDDGLPVGTDAAAPFAIPFFPKGGDVGANTLIAVATDTSGQTATAIRPVRVSRFTPRRLSLTVTPRRDRRAPYRFRARGTLQRPTGVTAAQGCREGSVSIRVRRGARTFSTRRVNLRRNCTYTAVLRGRSGSLRVRSQFLGNEVFARRTSATRAVRGG